MAVAFGDTSVVLVVVPVYNLLEDTEAIEPYSVDTMVMDCHWYSNGMLADKSEQNQRSACSHVQFSEDDCHSPDDSFGSERVDPWADVWHSSKGRQKNPLSKSTRAKDTESLKMRVAYLFSARPLDLDLNSFFFET